MSILFEPIKIGDLSLNNRIILAPLTRCRADYQRVPNNLIKKYYSQRVSFGMIISEATSVDLLGVGYPRTPGIWNEDQVKSWRNITDAVHEKGGTILMQLWHVGRISDPIYIGQVPIGPSAIAAKHKVSLVHPEKFYETPREVTLAEIKQLVEHFRNGAKNAKKAGFDGVELHGANGYLLDQFLQSNSNIRKDQYGGSIENRAKFPLEVVDAVIDVWGPGRVGYHISPRGDILDVNDENPLAAFSYFVSELSKRNLAFICAREYEAKDSISPKLKSLFSGKFILNEGFTKESGNNAILNGNADAIAFGQLSISNPDLVQKFKMNEKLNQPNPKYFYNEHKYLFDLAEPISEKGYYEIDKIGYTE
ncbi:alkene reductase [Fluviispira multicolorata]|uniref:Alkene reductase n=1 Tax=Fluviispira multicolorata TaxID=2654512 RepID=A0A833JG09_9BACT|nr:alkene reductase [Fluviispira multicolorata]KAB8033620.1 alkene reductase [Fluviispira multicolorata]